MEHSVLHRKERIILTTIDLIDEYGIQGVSTREVAKRQGVTEAAVFKHFPKKNDLLHAVLDYYTQYDSDIKTTAWYQEDPLAAITYFVLTYAEYYENYPQITAINQSYAVLASDPEFKTRIEMIYFNRRNVLCDLVRKAQLKGLLSNQISVVQLTDTIWGFFRTACLTWRFENYCFSLKDYVASTLQVLLNTYTNKERESGFRDAKSFSC